MGVASTVAFFRHVFLLKSAPKSYNPLREPQKPLPTLIPSIFVPKTGFLTVKALRCPRAVAPGTTPTEHECVTSMLHYIQITENSCAKSGLRFKECLHSRFALQDPRKGRELPPTFTHYQYCTWYNLILFFCQHVKYAAPLKVLIRVLYRSTML